MRLTESPLLTLLLVAVATVPLASCALQSSRVETVPVAAEEAKVASAEPATEAARPVTDPEPTESAPPVDLFEVELEPGEVVTDSPRDELAHVRPAPVTEAVEPVVEEPQYDIPIEVNDKVRFWLEYYTQTHKKSFQPGLDRSGAYVPMFRRIFAEKGLPQDLVYMAHVESAFKDNAYSRARALGIWQFISSTAQHYGLRIDYWVDERRDPEKAANAAADYLEKLYGDFGDWYLALAAYNGGEGRVGRALERSGETDFWGLAETRHLRLETKNYVPAIIAATMIHKDPEAYGMRASTLSELEYDTVSVDGAVDLQVLADCADADFGTLQRLNPMLRRNQTPPNANTDVRVPTGSATKTLQALARVPQSDRVLYVRHKIRNGDTLYDLARAYNVSVGAIQQANNMGRRTMIREGKVLVIPTVAAGRFASNRAPVGGAVELPAGRPFTYKVRRGDTLSHVAKRYDTTPSAIAAASGTRVHSTLSIGQRLTVVPGARSSAAARSAMSGDSVTASASGTQHHTVRRGDSLWKIATRYRTTVDSLCELNRISPNVTLYPGTRLTVSP